MSTKIYNEVISWSPIPKSILGLNLSNEIISSPNLTERKVFWNNDPTYKLHTCQIRTVKLVDRNKHNILYYRCHNYGDYVMGIIFNDVQISQIKYVVYKSIHSCDMDLLRPIPITILSELEDNSDVTNLTRTSHTMYSFPTNNVMIDRVFHGQSIFIDSDTEFESIDLVVSFLNIATHKYIYPNSP